METKLFAHGERPIWDAPSTCYDNLRLFSAYDPSLGLSSLLNRLTFSSVVPTQVYRSVLNRMPEGDKGLIRDGYDPKAHYQAALSSPEFQARIVELVAAAYPEKVRLIFVHVPKCSGTDLILNLSRRAVQVRTTLADPNWASRERLFEQLMRISVDANLSNALLLAGHVTLDWVEKKNLFRQGDRLFSVIRDPIEMCISQANYVAGRMCGDQAPYSPDVRGWLATLKWEKLREQNPRSIALAVLNCRKLVPGNTICTYLGSGDSGSTLKALRSSGIEISEASRYGRWLSESWGIESRTKHNSSPHTLSRDNLDNSILSYLAEITRPDQEVYNAIMSVMGDKSAVRGFELA